MTTEQKPEPKRTLIQIRSTEQLEKQISELMNGTTLRKKSDVIFLAVQELYDRRFPPPSQKS